MSGLESAASFARRIGALFSSDPLQYELLVTLRDRAVAAQALREAAREIGESAGVNSLAYETLILERAAALDPEEPDHD